LNYYFDNATPPGQTFTTGTNPNGYVLNTLAIAPAGNSGSLASAGQAYTLSLYSVSGSTATLLTTFQSQSGFTFTDLDWLEWSGLRFGLQPNTTYAYTLHRNTAGWENLANITGNLYAGGLYTGEVAQLAPFGSVTGSDGSTAQQTMSAGGLSPAYSNGVTCGGASPCLAMAKRSLESGSAFEGMHPTFRQTPPMAAFFSTMATESPSCAARMAAVYPAGPPPMTTIS